MTGRAINLLIFVKSIDGGTGTFVLNLLKIRRLFNKQQFNIRIVCLERPTFRVFRKIDEIFFLHKADFYPHKYSFSVSIIYHFIEELLWLNKKIKAFESDLILGVDIHCNLLISLHNLLFRKRGKSILTTHINLEETINKKATFFLGFILKRIIGFLYNRANILICPSIKLKENLVNNFEIKKEIDVIYHGLELHKSKINKFTKEKKIIISVGRLVEQKDFLTLIKAFVLLQNKQVENELWIVGYGELRAKLKQFVKKLQLRKNIKFFGWKNNVLSYLKKANFFVLSSKREGFSYVLIEAMSCGLPVISTNTPYGPSEILGNGKYGILVSMSDKKEMSNAMHTLLTNKEQYEYYSKKALERSKYFSLDRMLKHYKEIVNNLINK